MVNNRALLNNLIDALDRLFDGETNVVDVHAIVYATAEALETDELNSHLVQAATALEGVLRNLNGEAARRRALAVTDPLRIVVAEALPFS